MLRHTSRNVSTNRNSPKFKKINFDKIIDKKNDLTLKEYLINYYKIENYVMNFIHRLCPNRRDLFQNSKRSYFN